MDVVGEYERSDDIIHFSRQSSVSRTNYKKKRPRVATAGRVKDDNWKDQPWATESSKDDPKDGEPKLKPLNEHSKDVQKLMQAFKCGHTPVDYSSDELGSLMQDMGYTYLPSRNKEDHPYVYHPALEGHPFFNTGLVKVNDHAHGKNKVHFKGMREIFKAIQHTHPHLFKKPA